MSQPVAVTAPVAVSAPLVADLAARRGRSVAPLAAEAIPLVADRDAAFGAFVEGGIDALERGDVLDHDVVTAELDARIADHRTRCG